MSKRRTDERLAEIEAYLNDDSPWQPIERELLQALKAEHEYAERECTWSEDDTYWFGSCGICWEFLADGPEENDTNYCPRCGGKIVEVSDEH